jgi:tetratricopeptide (TPR) repeat protein
LDLPTSADSDDGDVQIGAIAPEAKPRDEIEGESNLPTSSGEPDLPGSAETRSDLPRSSDDETSSRDPFEEDEALFDEEGGDPFGGESEDDIFFGDEGGDAFEESTGTGGDDLLEEDEEALFEDEEKDDPFAEQGGDPFADEGDRPEDGSDDGFLGEGDSFSFLGDDGAEEEAPAEGESEESLDASGTEDDVDSPPSEGSKTGDRASETTSDDSSASGFEHTPWDDESDESSLELDPTSESEDDGSTTSDETKAPDGARDEQFQPASPGIPEREREEPSEEDDEREEESSTSRWAVIALLACLVVAGAGYYVVWRQPQTDSNESKEKTRDRPRVVSLDIEPVAEDSYASMRDLVDRARANRVEGPDRGTLLFVESLYTTRYDDEKVEKKASSRAQSLSGKEGRAYALGLGAWQASRGRPEAAEKHLDPLRNAENDAKKGSRRYFAHLVEGIGHALALEQAKEGDAEQEESTPSLEMPSEAKGAKSKGEASDETNGSNGSKQAKDGDGEGATGSSLADRRAKHVERGRRRLEAAAEQRSELAAPLYWIGRIHEARGERQAALEHYERAAERQSNHVPSRLRAAQLHYQNGDLEAASERTDTILSELGSVAAPSETADAYHVKGEIYVARSASEKALEAFKKAIQKDSDRPETLRSLAETFERTEQYQEALNFFTSNETLGRDDPEVILGIVRAHMGLDQWQKAIDRLEKAQKLFPDDARFPFFLGKLYRERGDFSDARRAMQRAVERDGTLLEAYGVLAQLTWRLDKDPKRAERYVRHIVDHPEGITADVANAVAQYYRKLEKSELAEQWYRKALDENPNSWTARRELARLYLRGRKTDEALEILEQARKDGVEDVRLSAYLADGYRQAETYDEALREINKVLESHPEDAEYVFIRGRIHFDRGNYETARRDFNKAYEFDRRFHRAYFYVGRTAFKQGDYKNALKIFRYVLDYESKEGEYRYWMGRTFEALDRHRKALEEYEEATKVDEAYGIENPRLYVRRGRLMVRLGMPNKGKEQIAKALELKPEMTEALLAMGHAAFESKNYEVAVEHFERAIDETPDVARAQYRLGMSLIYLDRRRDGAEHLQKAVEYGYDDPEVYQTLGYLYKELGQPQLAIRSFKSYLKQSNDDLSNATRRQMLRQIEELGG